MLIASPFLNPRSMFRIYLKVTFWNHHSLAYVWPTTKHSPPCITHGKGKVITHPAGPFIKLSIYKQLFLSVGHVLPVM